MPTKKPRGRPRTQNPLFALTLRVGDRTYSSGGHTMYDALVTLPKPESIFTEGHLSIWHKDKKIEKYLTTLQTRRLFYQVSQLYIAHDFMQEIQ